MRGIPLRKIIQKELIVRLIIERGDKRDIGSIEREGERGRRRERGERERREREMDIA